MLRKNFNNTLVGAALLGTFLVFLKPGLTAFWVSVATVAYPLPELFATLLIWPFVHYHFFHFLANAFLLLYFWNPLERDMGMRRYVWLFVYATIFASALLLAFETQRAVIGMDSFAMAVCSYTIARMKENRHPEIGGAYVFVAIFLGLDFATGYGFLGNLAWLAAGLSFRYGERLLTKSK